MREKMVRLGKERANGKNRRIAKQLSSPPLSTSLSLPCQLWVTKFPISSNLEGQYTRWERFPAVSVHPRNFPLENVAIFLLGSGGFTSNSRNEAVLPTPHPLQSSLPLIRITRGFRILSESFTSRRITESGSQTDPEILEQKELQLPLSNSLKSSSSVMVCSSLLTRFNCG